MAAPYEPESSPDPLGQPDLSSPSYMRSPPSRDRQQSAARKSLSSRKAKISPMAAAMAGPFAKRSPRVRNLASLTPSPEPVGFEPAPHTPSSSERRRLLSPWHPRRVEIEPQQPEQGDRGAEEEELVHEQEQEDEADYEDEGLQINGATFPDTITTTVPLRTGEETPRKRKKRRTLTPKRRKGTPIANRTKAIGGLDGQSQDEEGLVGETSPTPKKRGPGRPKKLSENAAEGAPAVQSPPFRFQRPQETAAVSGASPGKRRRVMSDSQPADGTPLFAEMPAAIANLSNPSAVSQLNGKSPRRSPRQNRSGLAMGSASQAQEAPVSQDPTDEHDEFDSILESEDFTMVSLSSIPSGQQLRSLTRSRLGQSTSEQPARRSPRQAASPKRADLRSPPKASPLKKTPAKASPAKASPAKAATIANQAATHPPSSRPPNTPYGDGLLAGFSPATRRELRAGLRLGQELARRSVQAKKAAAAVGFQLEQEEVNEKEAAVAEEDATVDVFADLAESESSNLSTSNQQSRLAHTRPRTTQSPARARAPPHTRPRQLPSPDQSDEQDQPLDKANEMSWRYDTPAKTKLNPPNQFHKTPPRKPPPPPSEYSTSGAYSPEPEISHSSPDRQLFLEQAAAEEEASRIQSQVNGLRESSSSPSNSDDSSEDEEPPEMSEATKSLLGDATIDIWQTEAEATDAEAFSFSRRHSKDLSLSSTDQISASEISSKPASHITLPQQSTPPRQVMQQLQEENFSSEDSSPDSGSVGIAEDGESGRANESSLEEEEAEVKVEEPATSDNEIAISDDEGAVQDWLSISDGEDGIQEESIDSQGLPIPDDTLDEEGEGEEESDEENDEEDDEEEDEEEDEEDEEESDGEINEEGGAEIELHEEQVPSSEIAEQEIEIEDSSDGGGGPLDARGLRSAGVPPSPFLSMARPDGDSNDLSEPDEAEESIETTGESIESPESVHEPMVQHARNPPPQQQQKQQPKELVPPRRSKLPSSWRRQSNEPVIYSDEPELPPTPARNEVTFTLPAQRQKTFVTPESRKKTKYDDTDFSILSEFRGSKRKAPIQAGRYSDQEPLSSPTKRVRFASEDPDNPYYPTTPLVNTFSRIPEEEEDEDEEDEEDEVDEDEEDEDEEDDGDEQEVSETMSSSAESTPRRRHSARITWEIKPKSPPKKARKQGSWLSGFLPSWFQRPEGEPLFRFTLPNLPQLGLSSKPNQRPKRPTKQPSLPSPRRRTERQPTPDDLTAQTLATQAYAVRQPPREFSDAHYDELKRLYRQAKKHPFPQPRDSHITRLLGREISRLGWRKRVNRWELGVIAEFLRAGNPLAEGVTPEQVAVRLFSIWAVEVQKGRTGLGGATAGLFSTTYIANRDEVLRRVARMGSFASD